MFGTAVSFFIQYLALYSTPWYIVLSNVLNLVQYYILNSSWVRRREGQ